MRFLQTYKSLAVVIGHAALAMGLFAASSAVADDAEDQTQKFSVNVKGMSCSACARRLEKVLTSLPGLKSAKVQLEKEEASLEFTAGAKVDDEQIRKTIRQAGFVPGKIERPSQKQSAPRRG